MAERWVLLYSAKQDAYHVETEQEYRAKGPSVGGYRVVGWFNNQDAALQQGRELRYAQAVKDVLDWTA